MRGAARAHSRSKKADLFLGNAGTAFRPLTAALAFSGGEYRLSGVPRMHERPIGDLVDALRGIGARIDYAGKEGFPPLAVHPGRHHARKAVRVRGDVSSQFLTALLMALPLVGQGGAHRGRGRADLQALRRDHAQPDAALRHRGAAHRLALLRRARRRAIARPGEIYVEGDASSASYFLAAGAIAGGPVRVEGVGPRQHPGRRALHRGAGAHGRAGVDSATDWIEVVRQRQAAGRSTWT